MQVRWNVLDHKHPIRSGYRVNRATPCLSNLETTQQTPRSLSVMCLPKKEHLPDPKRLLSFLVRLECSEEQPHPLSVSEALQD